MARRADATAAGGQRGRKRLPGARGPGCHCRPGCRAGSPRPPGATVDGAAAQASPRTPPDGGSPDPARGHPRPRPLAAVCRSPPPLPFPPHPVGSSKARPKIPGPTSTNRRRSFGSALRAEAVSRGVAAGPDRAGRGQWRSCSPRASGSRALRLSLACLTWSVPDLDQSAAAGGGEEAGLRLEAREGTCDRRKGLGMARSLANRE